MGLLVQAETLAHRVVLVPLGELAYFPAGENRGVRGLEVVFDDESAVVDESVFVNDVEDLLVDVSQAGSDQEPDVKEKGLVFLLHGAVVLLGVVFLVVVDGGALELAFLPAGVFLAVLTLVLELLDHDSLESAVFLDEILNKFKKTSIWYSFMTLMPILSMISKNFYSTISSSKQYESEISKSSCSSFSFMLVKDVFFAYEECGITK
jgi:hypothetical protein